MSDELPAGERLQPLRCQATKEERYIVAHAVKRSQSRLRRYSSPPWRQPRQRRLKRAAAVVRCYITEVSQRCAAPESIGQRQACRPSRGVVR